MSGITAYAMAIVFQIQLRSFLNALAFDASFTRRIKIHLLQLGCSFTFLTISKLGYEFCPRFSSV